MPWGAINLILTQVWDERVNNGRHLWPQPNKRRKAVSFFSDILRFSGRKKWTNFGIASQFWEKPNDNNIYKHLSFNSIDLRYRYWY
jgi:hypothetical protein